MRVSISPLLYTRPKLNNSSFFNSLSLSLSLSMSLSMEEELRLVDLMHEIDDALPPELCNIIVNYSIVFISPEAAAWARARLLRGLSYARVPQEAPGEPQNLWRCKCHYRFYNSRSHIKCGIKVKRDLEMARVVLDNPHDTIHSWRDQLHGKHQCHFCTRLFPCNSHFPGWECWCWKGISGRMYCISCHSTVTDKDMFRYCFRRSIPREYEHAQLRAYHRVLMRKRKVIP